MAVHPAVMPASIVLGLFASFVPSASTAEVLVLAGGKKATGNLLSIDPEKVHFKTLDNRYLDLDRKEVFGIFAEDAPKKLLQPNREAKDELRIGSSVVSGAVLRYDPPAPFVFYVVKGKARIALLRDDRILYLRPGKGLRLDDVDRGSEFEKEVLKAMKKVSAENLPMALQLAKRYYLLRPTDEAAEVKKFEMTLRKAWHEKVKDIFKIGDVNIYPGTRTFLTYHFFSKLESFSDLTCRVWVQLADGTVYSAAFNYYTLRKSRNHHDTVEPDVPDGRIKRWRVVLEFYEEIADLKESEPANAPGWWDDASKELISWDEKELKDDARGDGGEKAGRKARGDDGPGVYFSRTLGKKPLEGEAKRSPDEEE